MRLWITMLDFKIPAYLCSFDTLPAITTSWFIQTSIFFFIDSSIFVSLYESKHFQRQRSYRNSQYKMLDNKIGRSVFSHKNDSTREFFRQSYFVIFQISSLVEEFTFICRTVVRIFLLNDYLFLGKFQFFWIIFRVAFVSLRKKRILIDKVFLTSLIERVSITIVTKFKATDRCVQSSDM